MLKEKKSRRGTVIALVCTAALLALVLCLSLSLPAAFAATEQRVELKT